MINRHQLITILLKEHHLDESFRSFISKYNDSVLLSGTGIRKLTTGKYIL